METIKKTKVKGVLSAFGVAFHQGFEGLIFVLLGLFFSYRIFQSPSFTISTLILKEALTLFFTIILVKPKKSWELFKMVFKYKKHRLYLFAGIFGTTSGNLFYLLAFQMAGAAYGGILTSIYPIFSFLLISIVIREKENGKVWMGVFIAAVGAIGFTLIPALISHDHKFSLMRILGIVFGLVAAFFWAVEGFLIHIASRIKFEGEKTEDAVLIRSFGTTFTSSFILLPLFAIVSTFSPLPNPAHILGDIFSTWQALLILLGISVNLVILRYLHVNAIKKVGAKITSIIDTNNFLIPPLFSIFLSFITIRFVGTNELVYVSIHWWTWLLIIPIIVGVFIVLYYHKSTDEEEGVPIIAHVGE